MGFWTAGDCRAKLLTWRFGVVQAVTREQGVRAECIRMRPHDHIGWVVDGPAGLEAVAALFLAEGAARNERLVYVAADPDPAVPARLGRGIAAHGVQIASIAEVYGYLRHRRCRRSARHLREPARLCVPRTLVPGIASWVLRWSKRFD
jgi:hypothetical protein